MARDHSAGALLTIEEALAALDTVVQSGKARYGDVSDWLAYRVARALGRCELKDITRIDSVEPRYNLLFRSFERDLLPLCAEEKIAAIPYNPFASGLSTGKHSHAEPQPEGTRFTLGSAAVRYQKRYWNEREFATIEELRAVGNEAGMSMQPWRSPWCWQTQPLRRRSSAPAVPKNSPIDSRQLNRDHYEEISRRSWTRLRLAGAPSMPIADAVARREGLRHHRHPPDADQHRSSRSGARFLSPRRPGG